MLIVYHNNRCKKSREGLEFIKNKGVEFEVVEYLKTPFTKELLVSIVDRFSGEPIELIRTQEKYYKEILKGSSLTKENVVEHILKEPKLLQRPLVDDGVKVVVGNPLSSLDLFFD